MVRRMNICVVTSDFYPSIGGMEQHVQELYRQMVECGHRVRVIHLSRSPIPHPISKLGNLEVTQRSMPLGKWGKNIFQYWNVLFHLIQDEYQQRPFDVIHWHDLLSGVSVRRFCRQHPEILRAFTNHSSGYLRLRKRFFSKKFFQYAINHANLILAPSQELHDCSREDFLPSIHYSYIPNGVDEKRYGPGEKKSELLKKCSLDIDQLVLFCPRRLAPKNGVFYLIQALPEIIRQIPKGVLLIAGEGDPPQEEERIRAQVKKDGMETHVRFLGSMANEEMPDFYRLADVVVMPSLMEAVSLAALESMASAKPVVASDVGGLSELFADNQRGILVPPTDSSALAVAIVGLLKNSKMRNELGEQARSYVLKNYTWKAIAQRTLDAYSEIRS